MNAQPGRLCQPYSLLPVQALLLSSLVQLQLPSGIYSVSHPSVTAAPLTDAAYVTVRLPTSPLHAQLAGSLLFPYPAEPYSA